MTRKSPYPTRADYPALIENAKPALSKLDLPELREMVSLLRYSSNNLNQLARRVHETGRVYAADMDDILQNQERIWQAASGILSRLAAIK